MAVDQYTTIVNGRIQRATPTVVSAGAGNEGDIVALGTDGRLDLTVMPVNILPDVKSIVSSENLTAGNLVNVWNDGGTVKVRKADSTTSGKEAIGFLLTGVNAPVAATVYFEGINTALSGLTSGSRYYLSTTAGTITDTPPNAAGNVLQYVGLAISTTELSFEASDGIIL